MFLPRCEFYELNERWYVDSIPIILSYLVAIGYEAYSVAMTGALAGDVVGVRGHDRTAIPRLLRIHQVLREVGEEGVKHWPL